MKPIDFGALAGIAQCSDSTLSALIAGAVIGIGVATLVIAGSLWIAERAKRRT